MQVLVLRAAAIPYRDPASGRDQQQAAEEHDQRAGRRLVPGTGAGQAGDRRNARPAASTGLAASIAAVIAIVIAIAGIRQW
jgi:hypothetical protein